MPEVVLLLKRVCQITVAGKMFN